MPSPPKSRPVALGALLALTLAAPRPGLGQAEAERLSASFRAAARRIVPAVVTVRTAEESPAPEAPDPRREAPEPGGSGVVVDADKGLILTNDHVVRGASRAVVTLPSGRVRPTRRIVRDPRSDLALLEVDPGGLTAAEWGDSAELETGDWVLAVGQPFGLSGTVTAGIVSGTGRGLGPALYHEDLIQTDAAINPGNSGGPLVNLRGQVVGISTALKTVNGGYEGIGFAIPSARARRVAEDLAEFGYVRRSFLGIQIAPVDPELAERIEQPGAVAVASVERDGPADRAGLKAGDVVLRLGDGPVRGTGRLKTAIEFAPAGEPMELTVLRDGRRRAVRVRPEARRDPAGPDPGIPGAPADEPPLRPGAGDRDDLLDKLPPLSLPPDAPEADGQPLLPEERLDARRPSRFPALGLRLSEPSPALVRRFGLDAAPGGLVVVGVEPDGPADLAGLELGMVITDAGDRKTPTLADFRAAVARREAGQDLVLRILKGRKAAFRVILGEAGAGRDRPPPDAGTISKDDDSTP